MTIHELVGKTAEEWSFLTDADLLEWAKQYFSVTKPEDARKQQLKLGITSAKVTATKARGPSMSDMAKTMAEIEKLRKMAGHKINI